MKFFIFFLLFSVSSSRGQSTETTAESSKTLSSQEEIFLLRRQVKRYVVSLAVLLLDEDTPKEKKLEILDEIKSIAYINRITIIALIQLSQSGIGKNEIDINKNIGRDEAISVWAKNQVELIRKKQLDLNKLEKREKELDEDFRVNLTLDGVRINGGGILFFVPAIGPAVSIRYGRSG